MKIKYMLTHFNQNDQIILSAISWNTISVLLPIGKLYTCAYKRYTFDGKYYNMDNGDSILLTYKVSTDQPARTLRHFSTVILALRASAGEKP